MFDPLETKGFRIPIQQSLLTNPTLLGVPFNYMVFNGLVTYVLMYLISWKFIVFSVLFHLIGVFLTKKEPRFMPIFKQYINQSKFYD